MSFILPGTPAPLKNPYEKSDESFEEAKAARHASRSRAKRASWDAAVKQLSVWTPAMAVEAMSAMPQTLQQQYLFAETLGLNRTEVLRFFPAVAPSTREAWSAVATPPAPKGRTRTPKKEV